MAYTLLPGIQQDHRGRLYQVGVYPNGKAIEVPYAPPQFAPRVREWNIPDDYSPRAAAESQFEAVRKTIAVVEWRESDGTIRKNCGEQEVIEEFVLGHLLPLMRWTGKKWVQLFSNPDWHVQYFQKKE